MMYWNINEASTSSTLPGGASNLNLNDLTDVAITNPQANQVLKYDGSYFINGANNIDADQITSGTLSYARLPPLNINGSIAPPANTTNDLYWDNVAFWLKADLLDYSKKSRIINNVNVTQDQAITRNNDFSLLFGATNNFLSIDNSSRIETSDFDWFEADYTIDAWVYSVISQPTTSSNIIGLFTPYSNTIYFWALGIVSQQLRFSIRWSGGTVGYFHPTNILLNQWNHIAFIHKKGVGIYLAVNGVVNLVVASVPTPLVNASDKICMGMYNNICYQGYIAEIRCTKGIARYTANFNPETDTFLS